MIFLYGMGGSRLEIACFSFFAGGAVTQVTQVTQECGSGIPASLVSLDPEELPDSLTAKEFSGLAESIDAEESLATEGSPCADYAEETVIPRFYRKAPNKWTFQIKPRNNNTVALKSY